MNDIDRWFDRTRRRDNRTVSLYACLLTGTMSSYFRYRLRYLLVVDGTTFAVHVAEFLIILSTLGGLAAYTVMILRVGSLLVSGAWWGLLEVMRERVRGFAEAGNRDAVDREIGSWLALSAVAAVVVTVGATAALAVLSPPDGDLVGYVYAVLIVVELASRLPVRVLHSGMFATRRVYRPLWTLFAPTAVQLVVIAAGAALYPAAAIVTAIVVSNALSIGITVRYAVRLYRLAGVWPRLPGSGRFREALPSIPLGLGVQTTLAGLALRLDAVAVLAIAGIYGTSTRAFDLTAGLQTWREIDAFQFFYLALPLFRGAYEATSVFYFDFVRLRRLPALREYRVWFFHRLLWITPVVTLWFWGLAVVLGLAVLPDIPVTFLLALLPLFVVRSFIGTYQIRLFAEGRFGSLNATTVLAAGLFVLVWLDVNPASDLVELTAAMIVLLIVHINLQHLHDRTPSQPTQLPLGDWLRTLAAETDPVRVGTLTIADWLPNRQRAAALRMTRDTLTGTGCLAFHSATSVVFFERARNAGPGGRLHLALQTATGGAAHRGTLWDEPAADGAAALARLLDERWLAHLEVVPQPPVAPSLLEPVFLDTFPDGLVADVRTREGARRLRGLDPDLLIALLRSAVRSLDDDALVFSVKDRWLSAIFDRNRVQMVFLLPAEPAPEQFQRWLRTLKAWRLGGAVGEDVARAN
ncbi:hypothetical protein FK535_19705 [Mycolicibacterium sp. 018/SC-01/001]|uniref:hypothetical protein n=1 Tax=Mycolicibacterium sp. 018/SC-01/001 TaxID=2592069 RepID=UPI00117DE190|nr:hypothetical protein [Mycolicibacterium sp. 018/SC-01/001]TRW80261.1 hypothetical protein FK535_19705 [Mycolicibacterium sp. 018/SC-01/001]